MAVTVGQTLGAYRLEALIGKGAFGQVFRAVATCDAEVPQGTQVAIKVLHDQHKDDERIVHRFHREGRLATKLSHPHVVKVLGDGTDKGEHYLILELAQGESLAAYLKKAGIEPPKTATSRKPNRQERQGQKEAGPALVARVAQPPSAVPPDGATVTETAEEFPIRNLPIPEAIEILRQVAGVLQAAQDIGLVHRDIKPDNIFVHKDKAGKIQTKVLDFGIAKDMMAQSMSLSSMGGGMGTPAFMSPEQCQGKPLDTRSDLYSLGATAYQMLTGRSPFPGPTASAYISQHLNDIPTASHKLNANVPENVSQVVDRLLAKKPEDRHQKPAELVEDLNRVERGEVPLKLYRPRKARKYSPVRMVAAVLVTFLIVAGGGATLFYFFMTQAAPTIKEEVGKAQFQAQQGKLKEGIESLDALITKYKALNKVQLLGDAIKLRDELRRRQVELEKTTQAQRAAKLAEYEKQGDDLLLKKDYEGAINAYRAALDYGETPELKKKMATCETRKKEAEAQAAAEMARQSEAQRAGKRGEYEKKGDDLAVAKDYEGAINAYQTAVGYGETPELRQKLGTAQQRKKQLDEAAATARAEEQAKAAAARAKQEAEQQRQNDYRNAMNQAKRLLGDPDRLEEAQSEAEKALDLAAGRPQEEQAANALVEQIGQSLKARREWAAVVEFDKDGSVREGSLTGGAVAVKLEQALSGRYRLVTRSQIAKVLKELNFGLTDLADRKKAQQFGKMVGARYLVTGSIVQIGRQITVAAQIFHVETGAIRQTAEVTAEDVDDLNPLIPRIAQILPMTNEEKDKYLASLPADSRGGSRAAPTSVAQPPSAVRVAPSPPEKAQPGAAVPQGWTCEPKRVKVLTPDGEEWKEIVYYTNSIGMRFALIPAGEFTMGGDESPQQVAGKCGGKPEWFQSEQPQHKVRITKPFYCGAFEATQGQYEAIMGQNPSYFKGESNPVECVSWSDAVQFCRHMSQKEGLDYRLPTEAEWEYACRAGSTTPFYTGGTISTEQANYNGNYTYGNGQKGEYREKTTPVGSFSPNAFGLYDMHGNVWEWCQDWYDGSYYANSPAEDPKGPDAGANRVLRGGSWGIDPNDMRSADRLRNAPTNRLNNNGFRVIVAAQE